MTLRISDTKAYRYADSVVVGKIVTGRKVRQSCERFLTDLDSMGDSNYRWTYDSELAERPVQFIERFMKPSKGDYDKMNFLPWQCFIEGNVFGWVDKETRLRRFREVLELVGRGNGKTTKNAGNAAYLASKDGEPGADIYLLANSKQQSGILFDECNTQIMTSPVLSKYFRTLRSAIYYDSTNSKIEPRASDDKRLDGLNPHGAIFDEIHAYQNYKLINVIKRAVKKRRQPLIWYISTMGDVLDGPLMDFYMLGEDILNGVAPPDVADRIFVYIAEIDENDDPEDSACWIKANPSLGKLLKMEDLLTDWNRAKLVPQERSDFINKQLNVFTDTGDMPYVDSDVINRNKDKIDPSILKGCDCYGGFDASLREDFTAANLDFPLPDGRFYQLSHSWIPQRKVDMDNEKIDYYGLRDAGLLTIIPGEIVDQDVIYDWYMARKKEYNIRSIGYDPANAVKLVQLLQAAGLECNVVIQGWKTLNDPMKEIKELLLKGKVVTNDNPLFWWYLRNVKLRKQQGDLDHENWVPTKRGRYRKIDGFAAFLDSHTEYMRKNPIVAAAREPGIEIIAL